MIALRREGCEAHVKGYVKGFNASNSLIALNKYTGVKDVKGFPPMGTCAQARAHAHTCVRAHPSHPSHPSQRRKENEESTTYKSKAAAMAFTSGFTAFTRTEVIMAVLLSVKANIAGVRDELNKLRADLRDRSIANAINDTVVQTKTAIARDIRKTYNLDAEYINNRLKIRNASRTGIRIEAALSAPGRRSANLIRFLERKVTLAEGRRRAKKGTLQGVFVQVKRGGATKLVRGAFIGNSGRTMFRRVGSSRLPIYALQTIDVPQAMFRRDGVKVMEQLVQDRFTKNLQRQIQRLGRGSYIKVKP
jgi:hypothetical protein